MIGKTIRLVIGACVCSVMCLGPPVHAKTVNEVIDDEMVAPYVNLDLEDNDRSYIYSDVGQTDILDTGDIIRGMLQVQYIDGPGGLPSPGTQIGGLTSNNELTAVFDIEVVQSWLPTDGTAQGHPLGDGSGLYAWAFGPDAAFGARAGDPAPPFAMPAGAMVVAFDDSTNDYTQDTVPVPGGLTGQEENLIKTAGDTSAGNNAKLWAVFGIPQSSTGLWLTFSATNNLNTIKNGLAPAYTNTPGAWGGFELDLIASGGLADNLLIPIPGESEELLGSLAIYGTKNKQGGSVVNNFDFISDSDLTIAVPLPPAVFAGLGLMGLGLLIRRRFF